MKNWGGIYSSRSFPVWLIYVTSDLILGKDDNNNKSSKTSINSEVGEIIDKGRTLRADQKCVRSPDATHGYDKSNDNETGGCVIVKNKGTEAADKSEMRDEVYEENIKSATKKCSPVPKRQNKKQKKASKGTGNVKTSIKGHENREEDTTSCTKCRLFIQL